MILGYDAIRSALRSGAIHCEPLNPKHIKGTHIDVTLGPWYWVFTPPADQDVLDLQTADPRDWFVLHKGETYIEIPPRGFALGHTREAIGTAPGSALLPTLHTRSTQGRWAIGCHPAAGWGDEGYMNPWTTEHINPHPVWTRLPIGGRVGCVAFERIEGPTIPYNGNYAPPIWTPEAMLPKKGNW